MKKIEYYENSIGIDEVGRGCLAGPVVAAAVVLPRNFEKFILKDSKKLSFKQRQEAFKKIRKDSVYALGIVSEVQIDKINILNATFQAMNKALKQIENFKRFKVFVDGPYSFDKSNKNIVPIVGGDTKIPSIMAASIVAKCFRDNYMMRISKNYPSYKWEKNFGYGTKEHLKNITKHGVCKHHRKSFSPIHNILSNNKI
tara:strand:- start:7790 stop:8386 length:597 start_codon:yes stop_codon:yes gene_type:complete